MLYMMYYHRHRNNLAKIGGSETHNSVKKEVSKNEENTGKPKEHLRDDHYLTHAGFANNGSLYVCSCAHTYTDSDSYSNTHSNFSSVYPEYYLTHQRGKRVSGECHR